MATRTYKESRPTTTEEEVTQEFPVSKKVGETAVEGAAATDTDKELDDLLNSIDELLEPNAQEFVDMFVQKGGE